MKIFFFICGQLLKGKSLLRSLMNYELSFYTLEGVVVDIGGGINPSYYQFFKKANNLIIKNIDLKEGAESGRAIDLEKSRLPFEDASTDQALLFNILEHIFNYQFLIDETKRILKDKGVAMGFIPFFINVHPDPHDYFRYTAESIGLIFAKAGFKKCEIRAVGRGPFSVNFNNILFLYPKIIRVIVFPIYYFLDFLIIKLKPKITERFPLGYLFIATK